MMRSNVLLVAAFFLALTGCDSSISQEYRQERSEKDYQRGIEEFNAGNVDKAIEFLSQAIASSPSNASARFQLAIIQQEAKKDYLGALCNFTEYARIAGKRDKAQIANDRAANCKRLLLSALALEHGIGENAEAIKALEKARIDLENAEKKIAELSNATESDALKIKKLESKNAQLAKLVERLKGTEDDEGETRVRTTVRVVQSNEESINDQKRVNQPKDIGDEPQKPITLNPEAKALFEQEEEEAKKQNASNLLPQKPLANADQKTPVAATSPSGFYKKAVVEKPEYYIVKEGDNLMKIAKRFYGDKSAWIKIRDANKATVGLKGEIKKNQRLRLP